MKSKKYKYPNWYSEELRGMLKLKRKLFRKYKRSHCDSWYHEFSSVRRTVKTLICRDFKDYINRVQSSLLSDPKFFWSFVKEKKGRTSIPNKVYLDDCCYDQPKDIVDAFAKLFCSSFNSTADDLAPLGMNYINKIKNLCFSIQITEDNVHQAINKLKNSSVSGVDQIPSFFIKDCSTTLLKPLCYLFNLCVKNASFPDIWKDARVTPVFKSGDFADVRNYRPVSILCNFSKVFENILHKQMYFNIKDIISTYQHGFTAGRSTLTNLTCMSQAIADTLDEKKQLDVIYTDISKAFDKINHRILLGKLSALGFSDLMVKFFSSYLSGRRNFVLYNGFKSDCYTATSGVPQGSTLGPLFFLIYINDVVDVIENSKILIFADDVKLYLKINCVEDCQLLQNDIDKIQSWCSLNGLPLNKEKCKVVTYSLCYQPFRYDYGIDGMIMQRMLTVKDLGVCYDSQFSFREQINNITSKAGKMLGFIIRNCKEFSNISILKTLYYSLVRTRLEYCSLA